MTKMLRIFIPLTLLTGFLFSQTIQGNYEMNYVTVHYTYEVRDSSSADDSVATYAVTASWPSSDMPMYTHTLSSFEVGDTIATTLVPLVTQELLDWFGFILTGDPTAPGVALNVDLNDDGTFTINDGSTYPTTSTVDCSTFATIPNVSEDGTWDGTTGYTDPENPYSYTMGWGISFSDVFAQFNAPDLINGQAGVDYGPGTDMENWGMLTINYADEAHTQITDAEIYWEAHDGVISGLGVDDDGELNGHTGIPVLDADTTTIEATAGGLAYYQSLGMFPDIDPINVFTDYGMLGGSGVATDEIDPTTGDTAYTGVFAANEGYLFDPAGADGELFSGDEALQATGYYFTYNFLEASAMFTAVFEGMMVATGGDLQTSLTAAADSVAFIYVGSDTSAAIGAAVGGSLYDDYMECATAGGGDACDAILQAGPTMSLVAVTQYCPDCYVNDSDTLSGWYEYYGYQIPTYGRLVFEVDNVCIPDNTTQRVNPKFYETSFVSIDKDAPVAGEFKLYGNHPNPFNPSTSIKFATEKFTDVTVKIYSLLGEEIATAHQGKLTAGTYDVKWYGQDNLGQKVPSGVYFYEVRSDDRIKTGKMLLLK